MQPNSALLTLATVLLPAFAGGADLTGSVVITHRLTRKSVTAPASSYSRGTSVELTRDNTEDVLDLERARVVVYLEGKLPARATTATMIQEGRRFLPETIVVPVGSTVQFPNHDPIFHNVFSLSRAKSFDLGNYSRNQTRSVVFPKPGVVLVHCHLHPNMTATILVAPNDFATVSDKSGRFRIPNVPPGKYTVVAWHRAAGFFRHEVDVTAEQGGNVSFLIPLEPDRTGADLARK
jgi:plastocyanin